LDQSDEDKEPEEDTKTPGSQGSYEVECLSSDDETTSVAAKTQSPKVPPVASAPHTVPKVAAILVYVQYPKLGI